MCVPPVENSTCAAFEEYEEVPETVPLDFLEEYFTWVASKLSIASTPIAPAAPERLDATHVTSSSDKSRGTVSGTSSYSSKTAQMKSFHRR